MSERQLTPVFDGAKDLPVCKGWYPCWPKWRGSKSKCDERRYWDGRFFSSPVQIGLSDRITKDRQRMQAMYPNSELYWCGLTAPYES